jgi:Zn-dependent protease
MDRFLSGLGIINEFCETDSLVFLAIAAVVLGLILALLIAIILWPLDGRVIISDDPMQHPFGDMPVLPRTWGEQ